VNRFEYYFNNGSELSDNIMQYVIKKCVDLKCDLLVLSFQTKVKASLMLSPYEAILCNDGASLHHIELSGAPLPELTRYLRHHPEVSLMVYNEEGYLGRGFINGINSQESIPVPIVMVRA